MNGPRDIIEGLSRRGSAAGIVAHLAEHGPSSAADISAVFPIGRAGARAQLIHLQASGAVAAEDRTFRLFAGIRQHRYYLDPDALRYAVRWLDALADRVERANRAAAIVPLAGGRTR